MTDDQRSMTDINIKVGDQLYAMACEDGQEQRLTELAAVLDSRFNNLKAECPGIADKHLLVMVGILLCDDIDLLRKQISQRDEAGQISAREREDEANERKLGEQDDVAAVDVRRNHLKKLIEKFENDGQF